jgi:choline dehydrogenase-like flavoprotein
MASAGRIHGAADVAPGTRLSVDAVVVGSGAGGAAVALELSKAGMKVAVLEEGRSFAPADLVTRPSWAFRNLYQGRGVMIGKGKLMVPLAAGRAVGGSTFINSAICFRAPDRVLQQWAREDGSTWTPERLEPLFGEIERALEVQKVAPEVARNNSIVFKRGADKLGLGGDFISRNAPGCVGCGVCQLGCPIGGKGSVDRNLLPSAIENGADIYSEVRAAQLLVEQGAVRGVTGELLDRDDRPLGTIELRAPRVFLGAGAFGTPQLLQRNKLANSSGQVGENLRVHPGQASAAIFNEEIRYWDGVTQGYFVDMDDAILETFTGTPELFWAALPLGQMTMGRLRNVATAGCMIRDQGKGRVRYQGEGRLPEISYELAEADRARFVAGARAMSRIWFAAGATSVFPMMNATMDPASSAAAALAMLPDDLPATRMNPYGSHPQGTCRMSADPKRGVCKPTGETHDVRNLYIADGSLFPTALGVNPQITILALATGIAREAAKAG